MKTFLTCENNHFEVESVGNAELQLVTKACDFGRVPHVRPQRTWAENGFFECFYSMRKNSCSWPSVLAT